MAPPPPLGGPTQDRSAVAVSVHPDARGHAGAGLVAAYQNGIPGGGIAMMAFMLDLLGLPQT
jgi:hypothetical protein